MTTTTTVLPPPVQQKFSAKLLSTPQARLIHKAFAIPKVLDEQSGDILRMRRYTRLETAPVPVNPAMLNPPAQTLNAIDIDAKIDWYARHNWRSKTLSNSLENPIVIKKNINKGHKVQAAERWAA